MEKEFVPYDIALTMKQLGFNEPCLAYYTSPNELILQQPKGKNGEFVYYAPLYQQAFRWFRDEHKMKFHIKEDSWNHWCAPRILIPETRDFEELCDWFETYEEAELACLDKLIEIVQNT